MKCGIHLHVTHCTAICVVGCRCSEQMEGRERDRQRKKEEKERDRKKKEEEKERDRKRKKEEKERE